MTSQHDSVDVFPKYVLFEVIRFAVFAKVFQQIFSNLLILQGLFYKDFGNKHFSTYKSTIYLTYKCSQESTVKRLSINRAWHLAGRGSYLSLTRPPDVNKDQTSHSFSD